LRDVIRYVEVPYAFKAVAAAAAAAEAHATTRHLVGLLYTAQYLNCGAAG
jgi:hypothetical protein